MLSSYSISSRVMSATSYFFEYLDEPLSEQEQEDELVEPFSEEEMRAAHQEFLRDIYESGIHESGIHEQNAEEE